MGRKETVHASKAFYWDFYSLLPNFLPSWAGRLPGTVVPVLKLFGTGHAQYHVVCVVWRFILTYKQACYSFISCLYLSLQWCHLPYWLWVVQVVDSGGKQENRNMAAMPDTALHLGFGASLPLLSLPISPIPSAAAQWQHLLLLPTLGLLLASG